MPFSDAGKYMSSSDDGDSSPFASPSILAERRMSTFAVVKLSKPASWNGESERYLLCSRGVSVFKIQHLSKVISFYKEAFVPMIGTGSLESSWSISWRDDL